MTISFLALLAFVGLVTDVGALYWNYGQLKRALDSAAVAASNEFRRGVTLDQMHAIALEMLKLQNVALADTTLDVFICDADGDGQRDPMATTSEPPWDGLPPAFYAICPDTAAGQAARKLVWIDAEQAAPVYFLHLFGVESVNIATNAVAEAATVDIVIVIDTSESMGDTTLFAHRDAGATPEELAVVLQNCNNNRLINPDSPTSPEKCRPLWDSKQAAKVLVDNLYEGYDQVAIVNFDVVANLAFALSDDLDAAKAAIDGLPLHDDRTYGDFAFVLDSDPGLCDPDCVPDHTDSSPLDPRCTSRHPGYPDTITDPSWGTRYLNDTINTSGEPCSAPNVVDNTILSTCTGCGIKVAGDHLKGDESGTGGRPGGVWVIVFLSDGAANLSMHAGDPYGGDINAVLETYPLGFCGGEAGARLWTVPYCTDNNLATRHCGPMHPAAGGANCPPGATYTMDSPAYDVEDFARDMTDRAALLRSNNPNECASFPNSICPGTDIAIYTVFLEIGSPSSPGELMLRYMAAVGLDGDRATDPCSGVPLHQHCGQYYYVNNVNQLVPVFEDIASRIFTRITH